MGNAPVKKVTVVGQSQGNKDEVGIRELRRQDDRKKSQALLERSLSDLRRDHPRHHPPHQTVGDGIHFN